MSSDNDPTPFQRKVMTRQAGLIGAQWWNEGLKEMSDPLTRRKALAALAFLGSMVAIVGSELADLGDDGASDDEVLEDREALKMQRELGWNFGAQEDALSFTGQASGAFPKEELGGLATELTPKQEALKPFYQATLFQAVSATGFSSGSASTLRDTMRPIFTPEMEAAFIQGLALEDLFAEQEEAALTTALVVDLPGPQSVAFCVGLARRFEPVFTFDNWPHPLGVVPAHLTLGAVEYYQGLLRQFAQERKTPAAPVFVLDRQRLAPYTDASTQFDNRYMARMPSAAQLRALGLKHVLYVMPGGSEPLQELDDLNDDFVAWRTSGLDVKLVAASDFSPDPAETAPVSLTTDSGDGGTPDAGSADAGTSDAGTRPPATASRPAWMPMHFFYFGGSRATHGTFWSAYPWGRPRPLPPMGRGGIAPSSVLSAVELSRVPPHVSGGYAYEPQARSTMFSSVPRGASGAPRPLPTGFGRVAMRVSTQSRALLGPAFASRSSWNRSSSSSGG